MFIAGHIYAFIFQYMYYYFSYHFSSCSSCSSYSYSYYYIEQMFPVTLFTLITITVTTSCYKKKSWLLFHTCYVHIRCLSLLKVWPWDSVPTIMSYYLLNSIRKQIKRPLCLSLSLPKTIVRTVFVLMKQQCNIVDTQRKVAQYVYSSNVMFGDTFTLFV